MESDHSRERLKNESALQHGARESGASVLILGATGFVGTQLAHHLLKQGEKLRLFVRNLSRLDPLLRAQGEVIVGDLTQGPDPHPQKSEGQVPPPAAISEALVEACAGVKTVYYLVHGLELQGTAFEAQEERQVLGFLRAIDLLPKEKRPKKIIYLGGLIPISPQEKNREAKAATVDAELSSGSKSNTSVKGRLSKHLRSRSRVGELLRAGSVPVIELQASIVLGAGSLSFELMRALTLRLPILPRTDWSQANCQPISLRDLLEILTAAHQEEGWSPLVQIGGPKKLTYFELLSKVAKAQHLIRPAVALPGLSVSLSAELMTLIVPEYAEVGKKLLESIEIETVLTATGGNLRVGRVSVSEAINEALRAAENQSKRQAFAAGQSLDLSTPLSRMAFRRGEGGAIQKEAFFVPADWLERLRQTSLVVPKVVALGGWSEKVWAEILERFERFMSDDLSPQALDLPLLGKVTRLKIGQHQGRSGTWILLRFAPRNFLSAAALGLGGALKTRLEHN